MVKVKNFSENLEKNFSKLGVEIKNNYQKEELKDKTIEEVVKYTLENFPLGEEDVKKEEKVSGESLSGVLSTQTSSYLPSYVLDKDENVKKTVENLINLFLKEGLEKSLKEARNYPPFIVDAFHDALVDKIIPELRKRNLID
jgi:hypothetical protein